MGHPAKARAKKPKYQVLGKKPVSVDFRLLGEEGIYYQRVRSEPIPDDPVFEAELKRNMSAAYDRAAKSADDRQQGRDRHDSGPYGKKSR